MVKLNIGTQQRGEMLHDPRVLGQREHRMSELLEAAPRQRWHGRQQTAGTAVCSSHITVACNHIIDTKAHLCGQPRRAGSQLCHHSSGRVEMQ